MWLSLASQPNVRKQAVFSLCLRAETEAARPRIPKLEGTGGA